jgi:isopentenyl-diphosphate Delta-isomerase
VYIRSEQGNDLCLGVYDCTKNQFRLRIGVVLRPSHFMVGRNSVVHLSPHSHLAIVRLVFAVALPMLLGGVFSLVARRNVWVQSFVIPTATPSPTRRSLVTTTRALGQKNSFLSQARITSPLLILSKMTISTSTVLSEHNGASTAYGMDMDQNALMETDMLVAVDENDILIPRVNLSKKEGHSFTAETPRATLHRAFSLFLFNSENKLLLTQRASSKITFPNVWTNTVCSHPLYDMNPNEADVTPDAYPHFPGIKHAAVRKGHHELGLSPHDLPVERMQFITRFHYWAADTVTYGKSSPWGEHEVDYILFVKADSDTVPVQAHPDEVADYKYVSMDELKEMRRDPTLLWSPWFLGIMERGGWDWWADLDGALAGKYTNDQVTYFDPPEMHVGQYNLDSHSRQTGVLSKSKSL